MDLDVIWQVYLWGPMTRCVRWGSLKPQGKVSWGSWGQNLQPKHATANCCRHLQRSDSTFSQITLVLAND